MFDQAESLRKIISNKNKTEQNIKENSFVKIFTVVSGKGGVGKTNVSVNLAISMAQNGKKVLVIDADIGMTNADIIMGINYKYDLFDYIERGVSLEKIIYDGPEGIKIISGGSGLLSLEKLNESAQRKFIDELIRLCDFDVIIIDNGAGISKETLSFIMFSHEVILVTTPEPTALTDAYRIIKAIGFYELKPSVKLIVNMVRSACEGNETFDKLYKISKEFLGISIENMGYVFDDSRVGKAIMQQNPVILSYPNSLAAKNIADIARSMSEGGVFTKNVSTIKQLGNRLIKIFGA